MTRPHFNPNLKRLVCYFSVILFTSPISAKPLPEIHQPLPSISLYQYGNTSALLSGAIEGEMTYRQLQSKGGFGLGTFNRIDGELIALDGKFYKISQKGKTIPVDLSWKTPFVELVNFTQTKPTHYTEINNYAALKQFIRPHLDNPNIPYAIKVTGTFQFLELRSRSPRKVFETKDVMEETYTVENIKGTLVGFWFPDYLLNLSVPEFHFHFIAENTQISGHVLELKAESADVSINKINQIEMIFPQSDVFKNAKIASATMARYQNTQMNNSH